MSLRKSFRKSKKKAATQFYKGFVKDLKQAKPGQYFKQKGGELNIASHECLDPQSQVEAVAKSFSAVVQLKLNVQWDLAQTH